METLILSTIGYIIFCISMRNHPRVALRLKKYHCFLAYCSLHLLYWYGLVKYLIK